MLITPLLTQPLKYPRLWIGLGWLDIVNTYRRTFFGPFWITLNLAIFSAAMTLVYGAIFGMPPAEYGAYIVCGMIGWTWAAALMAESGLIYISYSHFVKNTPLEKIQFIWASAYRQLLVFVHNLIVYAVLVVFGVVTLNLYTLLIIPAVVLVFLFSIPVTAVLATVFARYRDLQKLVTSAIVVLMMVTPIFWRADMIKGWRTAFIDWNPAYYVVEIIRRPLLGQVPDWHVFAVMAVMTVVLWIVGSLFYQRHQKYIVFWI